MKPYFDNGRGIQIYLGDSREILPTLARNSIDLVLCDPPYAIEYLSNHRIVNTAVAQKIHGDGDLEMMASVLALTVPLLKQDRHLYYFASADESIGDACRLLPAEYTFRRLLCWDKENHGMGDLEANYGQAWEAIIYASKGRRALNGNRPSNMLRGFSRGSGATWVHPTQKPTTLLRFLIEKSTLQGETVIDPFLGSGTTLRAALDTGRKGIGIEVNESYCQIAAQRMQQQSLFATMEEAEPMAQIEQGSMDMFFEDEE